MKSLLILANLLAVFLAAYDSVHGQKRKPVKTIENVAARSRTPVPAVMSHEKTFYYFVAMHGFREVLYHGGPDDIIEIYGKAFDGPNYNRSMADEFERERYKQQIRTKIANEIKKIDYGEKFSLETRFC